MTQYNRRRFLKTAGATGAVGLSAGCLGNLTGGGGGTPTINFHFVVPVENVGSLLAIEDIRSQMENLGDAYEISVTRDSSTPDSVQAMAAGEADVILTTTVSFASAVVREAVPGNVTAIATDFWDAHPDWYSITIFSGPDSGITEPADLEGQRIGVNATGTGVHAVAVKKLQQVGLDPENDVEFVEFGFPTFISAINEDKMDAGVFPALFAVGARGNNFNKVFTSAETYDGAYPFAYVTASNNALDEKGDAIDAWVDDYVSLFEYARNNRSEVVSLAAEHFGIPEAVIGGFFMQQPTDYYRGEIATDTERLQTVIDDLNSLGFIDESITVSDHVDNGYLP
ncbi:MAG: ABC transporter substrate-binding protein [Halobacteriales archaeon]